MPEKGKPIIDNFPVPEEEREWYPVQGLAAAYYPPKKCIGCEVLTRRAIGEAMGLPIEEVELPEDVSNLLGGQETYDLVGNTEAEAQDIEYEFALRVEKAADGSCEFIEEQACWRLVKE